MIPLLPGLTINSYMCANVLAIAKVTFMANKESLKKVFI